jgi:pimeloyl-ACP methyl ester carboxylesterase
VADGDRTARLSAIRCPTLVIHGHADPQIHVSGGQALAAAIADARLLVLDEMGHDLAPPLFDAVANAIANHVDDARAGLNPAVEANTSTRRAR